MKTLKFLFIATIFVGSIAGRVQSITSSSASAISSGEAITADAVNTKALQYNVGALGLIKYYEIELSHLPYYFNTSYEQLSFVTPIAYGGMGVSVQFFHSFFDTENFNFIIGEKNEMVQDYELKGSAGVGFKILKNLGIGGGINYLHSSFLGESQNNLNFNVGILYRMRLFSKLFHSIQPQNRIGGVKEDIAFGVALNNIGADDVTDLRSGISIMPIKWIKLFLDGDLNLSKYYDTQFKLKTGLEFNIKVGFTKFFLSGGYSFADNNLVIGTGFQINFGEKFYRLDYAHNMGNKEGISQESGTKLGAFSFTVGKSELLLNLIKGKGIILPSEYFRLQDKITVQKQIIGKKEEQKEKKFGIKITDFKTDDKYVDAKKYNIKLTEMLINKIKDLSNLKLEDENPDLTITGIIEGEGELMRCLIEEKIGGKTVDENSFEKTITYDREAIKNYDTVDILVKKVGEDIKIIPVQKGIEEDKDLKKVEEMAKDIAEWINDNIKEVLSAKYNIVTDTPDVDIYVDGEYEGRVDESRKYQLSLLKGKHELIFIKENRPAKEIETKAEPGAENELKVEMMQGNFYVEVDVNSFPKGMEVWIDNKKYGKTPVKAKRIPNGTHTIRYKSSGGEGWEEELIVNREGIYKLYGVEEYREGFKKLNKNFWNVVEGEKGLTLEAKDNVLEIIGKSRDGVWKPTGVVSREFKAGELEIKTEFKIGGNKFFTVIGVIDENGEGVALGIDERYFQYYETGKEASGFVPALNLRDKDATHKLEMRYKNGQMTIMVDDMIVVESREKELSDRVRVMILSDNETANSSSQFSLSNFKLENRL